jgi:hypothetical protein
MIKGGANYNSKFDSNYDGTYNEISVKDFVSEMESKLGHQIKEYYDVQKVPAKSSVGYNYFATDKGYLLWGICISCGVTQISTLLMDGYTPTVNIVSAGMKGKVTKALTREEMLNHSIFKELYPKNSRDIWMILMITCLTSWKTCSYLQMADNHLRTFVT